MSRGYPGTSFRCWPRRFCREAWRGIGRRILPAAALLLANGPALAQPDAVTAEWIDGVWFNHLLKRASDLRGDPVFSEAFFRDALRVNPRSADVVEALARMYDRQGESALAAGAVEYGRLLDPQRAFWTENAEQRWQRIRESVDAPDQESIEAFNQKLNAANSWGASNNFMLAELGLRDLLKTYPRHTQLLLDLGRWYAQSQDWGALTLLYAYFHRLDPDRVEALNNYCAGLHQAGLDGPALSLLQPLLDQQPTNTYLLSSAVPLALGANRPELADQYAARWALAAPQDPAALLAHARVLILRRKFEPAGTRLQAALKLQPDRQETVYLQAELAVRLGDVDAAERHLKRLRELVGDKAFAVVLTEEPFRDSKDVQRRFAP